MITWQVISYYHYHSEITQLKQIFFISIALLFTFAALFFRSSKGEISSYMKRALDPFRQHMVIVACILVGGVHFLSLLGNEPVYLHMGYMILIIAFYETSSIAIDFYSHYSNGMIETTKGNVQRLLVNYIGKFGMVFALSVIMLYLSLMIIVGFTGPFSVAFLAALMILAISFMTMVRRL